MENKLNHNAIEKYSEAYCKKILTDYFSNKEKITGKEILKLTETRQINLFVLKNLFIHWKEESKKLESPFFDYQAEEVQRSLEDFLNILSRHISISKQHLVPLMKQAVQDTLLLILSPYDFFVKEIKKPEGSKIKVSVLNDNSKYIIINKHFFKALIEKFESEGTRETANERAYDILEEVFENFKGTPEDIEGYIKELSNTETLNIEFFYDHNDEISSDKFGTTTEDNLNTLNTQFIQETKTLNESLSDQEKTTVVEELKNQKIESINNQLTANQIAAVILGGVASLRRRPHLHPPPRTEALAALTP